MKKWHSITILAALMVVLLSYGMASAADVIIDKPIDSLVFQPDKNGNEYGRAIVTMEFDLDGHKYTKGVPVMAFAEKADILKSYKEGDTLRCIASFSEQYGSYTIQSFIRD